MTTNDKLEKAIQSITSNGKHIYSEGNRNTASHGLGSALANLKPYLSEQNALQVFKEWAGEDKTEFKNAFLNGFSQEPSGNYNPHNNSNGSIQPQNAVKSASEWKPAGNSPLAQFLGAMGIKNSDEVVLVSGRDQAQSKSIEASKLIENASGFFKADWIRIHKNRMEGGRGFDNIKEFNHCLIDLDTDEADPKQSINLLKKSSLPLVAIIQTRKNRFHALCWIDAKDATQAKYRQERIKLICKEEGLNIDEKGTDLHKTIRLPDASRRDYDFKHRLIATRKRIAFDWGEPRPTIFKDTEGLWIKELGKAIGKMECWFNFTSSGNEGIPIRLSNSQIQPLTKHKARGDLPEIVEILQQNRKGAWTPALVSATDMEACLSATSFITSLPLLRRFISRPLPSLKQGTLITPKRGYNQSTEEFYSPSKEFNLEIIPKDKAVSVIEDAIKTIQFETFQDKLRYLCTMFDPFFDNFHRGQVPMILTIGNQSGIGKDASRELIHKIFGWDFQVQPAEQDKTEFTKILGSVMASGLHCFHIDEPGNGYESKKITNNLRSSITGALKPRLLGTSTKIEIPFGFRFSMSAKRDIVLDSDMPRRCLPIFLHAAQEALDIDWERKNWHGWMIENADSIYQALHSIVHHWHAAGKPKSEKQWEGQFRTWSLFTGSLVKFIMQEEPFEEAPHTMLSEQVEVDSIVPFMSALCRHFEGRYEPSFKDVASWLEDLGDDDENYYYSIKDGKMETKAKRRLWRDLRNANKRVFDGLTFRIIEINTKNASRTTFNIK